MSEEQKPEVPYWHLWTDEKGVSHQKQCFMTAFEFKSIGEGVAPQWQSGKITGEMAMTVSVQPVGWIGQWHENPKPQWIIPLSGRWFVEAMDGTRVEMGPGEISFGEDQNCASLDGRTGHLSGTVGDEPAVLLAVQFADKPPERDATCRFFK
ncbi:MAG TPA: cupin domain-containing protein [Acetobacteraceae bacterium]|nr:cupin domain-containing protein [Acetobacteraceae bacterium]